MPEHHRWKWLPLESIGGLRFDEPLPDKLGTLKFERVEDSFADIDDNIDAFEEVGGKTQVFLEDGRVGSVFCRDNFFFESQDLIGLSAEEAMAVIGGNWVLDDEDDDERVFIEDDLEITIWEEDGAIDTIVVHGPYEED